MATTLRKKKVELPAKEQARQNISKAVAKYTEAAKSMLEASDVLAIEAASNRDLANRLVEEAAQLEQESKQGVAVAHKITAGL
jgi:hypothetical protein